jgi:hypothetical protein
MASAALVAGELQAGPAAPDEQRRCEEKDPHRVSKPPHEPQAAKSARGLRAAHAQAGGAHRSGQRGAEACGEAEQAHDVPDAIEALVEANAVEEPRPPDRFQRVAGGDGGGGHDRLVGEKVGGERAQPHPRPHPEAENEQGGQGDAGGRPHHRDLLGYDREPQPEAGGAEVEEGDNCD